MCVSSQQQSSSNELVESTVTDSITAKQRMSRKKDAKVVIRCRACNTSFSVLAGKHLFENIGCARCSGNVKKTTEEFVAEALKVHKGVYDYTKVVYTTRHEC